MVESKGSQKKRVKNSQSKLFSVNERKARAQKIIALLEVATKNMRPTLSTLIIQDYGRDPFLILISCLLSLRARDSSTINICTRLFSNISKPQDIINISLEDLEKLIYPVNYYKVKAKTLKSVCQELITRFNGKVPNNQEDLLSMKGVGPKTSALVLAEGFGIPAIIVDVHMHRVSNRLGIISTTTVKETEQELKAIIPENKWIDLNRLFVTWGQNICVPISPFCSKCVLLPLCQQKGVISQR